MTPQEIRQFAERLVAQSKSIWMGDGTAPAFRRYAQEVIEWYTSQLRVLADRQARAAASDIEDLDEMLMARHLKPRAETETLRQAIDRIINWEVATNLDPLVSSAAQDLVERGRKEAQAMADAQAAPDQALVTDAIRGAVRREADAWRAVVEVERQRAAAVEERYWELVRRMASLSMVSMPGPRVVVDQEKLQPDDELGRVLAARGWL